MPTALLLVDHGSVREEANQTLVAVARLIENLRHELIVEIAHMELAKPSIAEGFAKCVQRGATEVIVHPYMLAPGRHATEDIPRLVHDVAAKFPNIPYQVSEPLGVDELIATLVLKRAGI